MTVYQVDYLIPHGRTLFTLLLTANFWSAAGAYAVLALFTYFAVRHPMFYIVKVTDRRTGEKIDKNILLLLIIRLGVGLPTRYLTFAQSMDMAKLKIVNH